MKASFTYLYMMLIFTILVTGSSHAQSVSPLDTTKIPAINYNSGFDVIIKRNGDIIYGLIKEVGMDLVKYQRTDIPDGPIYTIPREEIYAISYRNQVKDFLNSFEGPVSNHPYSENNEPYRPYGNRQRFYLTNGRLYLGVGFLRSFTGVKNADSYSVKTTFPTVSIAYDAYYRNQVRLGLATAIGSREFSKQEYSSYDSTRTDVALNETIFTLYVYGKYTMAHLSAFEPYLIGGLGVHSSYIRSEYDISFVNDPGKIVVEKSGSRTVNIGVLARIGTDYFLNNKVSVFADVGLGPSILNIGIAAGIN